jgi:hypothetical protein
MPHTEAQAWWADVQHVRETIERRRAALADSPAPRDAGTETRFARSSAASPPSVDDLDWSAARPADRSDHTARLSRAEAAAPPRGRRPWADPADRTAPRARRDDDHIADARLDRARWSRRDATDPRDAPDVGVAAPLAPPSRRTVEITGRTVAAPLLPRLVEVERRRPPRRPVERVGGRPDRIALWAVLLAFFLILVAATSSRAATPTAHGHAGAAVALHAPAR